MRRPLLAVWRDPDGFVVREELLASVSYRDGEVSLLFPDGFETTLEADSSPDFIVAVLDGQDEEALLS